MVAGPTAWFEGRNPTTGRHPKGFIIECIATDCMGDQETHYGELFARTLDGITSRYATDMLRASSRPSLTRP